MNQPQAQYAQPPRKRSALEDSKLTLMADNGQGRKATLRASINSGKETDNNVRFDVYTNIPNDNGNGHARVILDFQNATYFLTEAERIVRGQGPDNFSVQQMKNRFDPNERKFIPGEKFPIGTIRIVKEDDGRIFMSVLNGKATPIKFYFIPMGDYSYLRKDNKPVSDADLCRGFALTYLANLRTIITRLYVDQYQEPPKKEWNGDKGGQGNQGGGGNYQRNNQGGGNYQNNQQQRPQSQPAPQQQQSQQQSNAPAVTSGDGNGWGETSDNSYDDGFESL